MPRTPLTSGSSRPAGRPARRTVSAAAAVLLAGGLAGAGFTGATAAPSGAPEDGLAPAAPTMAPANPARAFEAASSIAALSTKSVHIMNVTARKAAAEAAKKARAEKAKKARAEKAKKAVASARGAQTASRSTARVSGSPRAVGRALAAEKGWGGQQFACLDKLWTKESSWRTGADNPTSSAYGIPQALPGHRMSSHGSDWRTNPATQIRWGLDYIDDRYGSPCAAWAHSRANNWY